MNVKGIRSFARDQILKRMNEIKNDGTVRNDILTFILKSQGICKIYTIVF
jgi:hypothetical protein